MEAIAAPEPRDERIDVRKVLRIKCGLAIR